MINRPFKRPAQTENEQPMVQVGAHMVPIFGQLDNNELAVVDLNTLMRLASMLPKAHIEQIVKSTIDKLDKLKEKIILYAQFNENNQKEALAEYTEILESELRFQRTINQITLFAAPKDQSGSIVQVEEQ